ncbi:bifunctional RNase H/acid phosphatase [Streptomyces sp. SAT1]|uniref:bifunctional RNase H/acid phosphatase n=1 Tax=Streptomyces sp. SAT1 TaxID=1849967 RepID=UPI0007DD62A9|nr:bifunctional RNase H/acid phosphatase [Streptomyces sp. SAT1]ANH91277.1 bifunctional RNase H/acid phosphatase [Streptomyces sp. SAT1]
MREFIVEADGGSRGNPGPAGYGAVVFDASDGQPLAEAAEYLGTVTNNVAEYRGLLAGLRAAHALDPGAAVHVRMDSKLVVEQMSGRWRIKHPDLQPLAAEAARVFPPGRVTYEWIPRARNKHADRLANEAMDAGARGEPWSSAPASASTAATAAAATRAKGTVASAVATEEAPAAEEAPVAGGTPVAGGAPDPKRAADQRTADQRAVDQRTADQRAADQRTADQRAADQRTADQRAADQRTADQRAADQRTADQRAARTVAAPGWAPADLGAPATLVLLRHGETPLTPQKRFSGSGGSDPSLSAVGREQAERAAAALARRGTIQAVVSSPLARTRETAAIVAARLGLAVTVDEDLRETDFGAWEGLTFGEVRERHQDDLNAWLASPEAEPTGGGESFAATAVRIAAARDRLVAAHAGRTVLVVTHVTPIKTFVRLALGAPAESLFRMELSAASLSAVAYYADGNASVRLLNDTSHLR